jgi:hypothetical protein
MVINLNLQLPALEAEFDPRAGHVGFVVGKVRLGQVFSEYFGFPGQFLSHQLLPLITAIIIIIIIIIIVRGCYNRPSSGLHRKWIQSHSFHNL